MVVKRSAVNVMINVNKFNIFADYSQFYLLDGEIQPLYPEDISEQDVERRFKTIPNLVALYTVTPAEVTLTVDMIPSEPEQSLETWEHVVEVPLDLPSGLLLIAGCTDYLPDCPIVEVTPGAYAVRVHGRKLNGGDREEYLALLWPSTGIVPKVLKQQVATNGRFVEP